MSTLSYTQEQLDIALLKQQYSEINNSLIRIEKRFDQVDDVIKDFRKEIKSEIRQNFFWILGLIGGVLGVVAHGLHWF